VDNKGFSGGVVDKVSVEHVENKEDEDGEKACIRQAG
jgi:hypothetical protein